MPYIDHALTKYIEEHTEEEHPTVENRTRTKRVPNPYYGRFQEGMLVKVAAWSDAFMMGVASGRVVKVGREHVHVRWNLNERDVLKFPPEHLLPETEWED